jgi:tRNA-dihydrouridine synthase
VTGEPGPPATYIERLTFMDRHFRLLVEHKSERFACLSFRKVANWYCRVLRPGRAIQQQLMQIDSVVTFARLVEEIREIVEGRAANDWPEASLSIPVPGGPIEHW